MVWLFCLTLLRPLINVGEAASGAMQILSATHDMAPSMLNAIPIWQSLIFSYIIASQV